MEPVPEVDERVSVGDRGFIVNRGACGSTLQRLGYGKCDYKCTNACSLTIQGEVQFQPYVIALRVSAHTRLPIFMNQQLHQRQSPLDLISRPQITR